MNHDIGEFLQRLQLTTKAIIVEGKKDRAALRQFTASAIYVLDKPLFAVAEEIAAAHSQVIILTDLDSEGKQLYGTLSSQLQRLGVEVDNYFREFLFKNTQLRQIEGLTSFTQKFPLP